MPFSFEFLLTNLSSSLVCWLLWIELLACTLHEPESKTCCLVSFVHPPPSIYFPQLLTDYLQSCCQSLECSFRVCSLSPRTQGSGERWGGKKPLCSMIDFSPAGFRFCFPFRSHSGCVPYVHGWSPGLGLPAEPLHWTCRPWGSWGAGARHTNGLWGTRAVNLVWGLSAGGWAGVLQQGFPKVGPSPGNLCASVPLLASW